MSKPNILFIMVDDHRYNAIRALGNTEVNTPNLDRLVREGTTLTHTYIMGSTSPAVCMPSRAMLLTGRSLFHAMTDEPINPYPIAEHVKMLPELFREAGYQTFGTGKWHNPRSNFARSFAGGGSIFFGGMSDHDAVPVFDYDPDGIYPDDKKYTAEKFSTELFGDEAIGFLQQQDGQQPFFLYTAFTAPHDPRTPPAEFAYDPDQITLPENFLPEHPFDNGEMRIRDEVLAPFPRTPDVIRQHIADYYGMITHLDAKVGQLLQTLDDQGLAENTLVVYTGDHGLAVGQHGLMGKQNLYDHSTRVPLILRGPGIPANQRHDALCYLYDLFPTLCELTDQPIPPTNEGNSLVSLIKGEKTTHRSSIFSVYQATRHIDAPGKYQRMVREGDYKLIAYAVDGNHRVQLFDLKNDPLEMHDLASDPAQQDRIAHLRQVLVAWQQEVDDPALQLTS